MPAPARRLDRLARFLFALGVALMAAAPVPGWAQSAATSTPSAGRVARIGDHEVLIESFQQRLDGLSSRLAVVADKVDLLQETALGSDISETRAVIVHKNDLGNQFTLEQARYVLDGGILMDRVDPSGGLADIDELVLFDGKIRSGDHLLEVEVVCRGGGFGVFSYVEAYRFRLKSRYVLTIREGRVNRLEVVVSQSPDITVEPAKRLRLDYDFEIVRRLRDAEGGGGDPP